MLRFGGLSLGCQLDHVPLFDEEARTFVRCDLWSPNCPPKSDCEVAGAEVREKLGLSQDQADFLCCIAPQRLNDQLNGTARVTLSPGFRSANSLVPKRIPPRPTNNGWPSDPFNSYVPPPPPPPPRLLWPTSAQQSHQELPNPSRPSILDRVESRLKISQTNQNEFMPIYWNGLPSTTPSTPRRTTTLNPWQVGYRAPTTARPRIFTFPTSPPWNQLTQSPYRPSNGREANFPRPQSFLHRLEQHLKLSKNGESAEVSREVTTPSPEFDAWGRRIHYGTTPPNEDPIPFNGFPPHLQVMEQLKGDHSHDFDLESYEVDNIPGLGGNFPWDLKMPPGLDPQHYMRTTTPKPLPTTPVIPAALPISAPPSATLTPLMPTMLEKDDVYELVKGSGYNYNMNGDQALVRAIIVGDASPPTADGVYKWSGSVTLIQDDGYNILVDSGTAANRQALLTGLSSHGLHPESIQILVITHGHPDHIGNDNLFPLAVKVFNNLLYKGNDIMESQQMESILKNDVFQLTKHVEIWKTPGHTMQHTSAIVRNVANFGSVAITGDLFISAEDLINPAVWSKRSLNSQTQSANRLKILCQVDVIVPGHGPMYRLTPEYKRQQCTQKKTKNL